MREQALPLVCAILCVFGAYSAEGGGLNVAFASGGDSHTLFFAGDSTLDEHGGDESTYGSWGSNLRPFLREGCAIVNYGRSGRSTTSFIREGWWNTILQELSPGDFVVVQFGHNDQKLDKPDVATPIPQYKENLRRMAADVRDKEASPIFATPIVRLTYGDDGFLTDTENLDDWAEAMREVAQEENVDLVDMRVLTRQAANAAGETEALSWNAPNDRTHPASKGARLYAQLFLDNIKSRELDVAGLFVNASGSLTVDHGDTFIVGANTTYDTVVVNGNLIVAAGVELTASKLFISQNNNGNRGTVTVQNGAKITMPWWEDSDSDVRLILGDGSPATLTLNEGSSFTASEMRIANNAANSANAAQPFVKIEINNATMFLECRRVSGDYQKGGEMQTRASQSGYSPWEVAVVELNGPNAVLRPRNIALFQGDMRIRFAGGRIISDQAYNWGNSSFIRVVGWNKDHTLRLDSVDGAPIHFIRKNVWSMPKALLFNNKSGNSIITSGSGALVVEDDSSQDPVNRPLFENTTGTVTFGHTGGLRLGPATVLPLDEKLAAVAASSGCSLFVPVTATFDLNGISATFDAVQSAGTIANTSETAATLTVGANGGDAVFAATPAVPVVKQGAGILRIPEGNLDAVSVQGGTIDLCNRAAVGYPYYRFKVLAPKNNIRLSEFALYNGNENVTGLRTAVSEVTQGGWIWENVAANLVDNNLSTFWDNRALGNTTDWRTNRVYCVFHYGNAPKFKHPFPDAESAGDQNAPSVEYSNDNAPLYPTAAQPVSTYTFAYDDKTEVTPSEWLFQGAIVSNAWRTLDHVVNYSKAGFAVRSWCGTNFVANSGISFVEVDSLTVADSTRWSIDASQADISIGTLNAGRDVTLVVSGVTRPTSKVELPIVINTLSGSVGTWRMIFEGNANVERGVCVVDGRICATPEATILYMR